MMAWPIGEINNHFTLQQSQYFEIRKHMSSWSFAEFKTNSEILHIYKQKMNPFPFTESQHVT